MPDFVEDTIEAIKASDLLLLMDVVKEATGLWNYLERLYSTHPEGTTDPDEMESFNALGDALRALGLMEVQPE